MLKILSTYIKCGGVFVSLTWSLFSATVSLLVVQISTGYGPLVHASICVLKQKLPIHMLITKLRWLSTNSMQKRLAYLLKENGHSGLERSELHCGPMGHGSTSKDLPLHNLWACNPQNLKNGAWLMIALVLGKFSLVWFEALFAKPETEW